MMKRSERTPKDRGSALGSVARISLIRLDLSGLPLIAGRKIENK